MRRSYSHVFATAIVTTACFFLGAPKLWAFSDYSGCQSCHGAFNFGAYTSLQDGTAWNTPLMTAHRGWLGDQCLACHMTEGTGAVMLNQSGDDTYSKGCVGCHGRDEDVTGNCVGGPSASPECGSGAGLRQVHETNVGAGTCSSCHTDDATPVGEDATPFNYKIATTAIKNACNADGTESRFGPTGLDNDGDGKRDAADSDCSFLINPGLNDAWYYPATAGQGFLISVFEEAGLVFLAWFTFDVERPPEGVTAILGEPGHRWLTAQGPFDGDKAELLVYETSGGVFDSPEPAVNPPDAVGTITVQWTDCNSATLTYDIDSAGQGTIPLQRIVEDNVPLCEVLKEDSGAE